MKYHIGDRFLLNNVECRVAFIDADGRAYLVPEEDNADLYNGFPLLKGLVFTTVNERGVDKLGNKVSSIINQQCGAV